MLQMFRRTILQYCSENQSIRLTGPPPQFVKIIFDMLVSGYVCEGTPLNEKTIRLCYHSLSNLSLVQSTHAEILKMEHLLFLNK